jgi:Tol biopolymer transport system component
LPGLLAAQNQFVPANLFSTGPDPTDLTLFPLNAPARAINIKFPVWIVRFAGDGRSLYASLRAAQGTGIEQYLVRIDLDTMRSTPVDGTQGFGVNDFAVTPNSSKILILGRHQEGSTRKCGVFEVTVSTGAARQVLENSCADQPSWTGLAIAPDGNRAVANYGNTTERSYRLYLIDLKDGATTSLGDIRRAAWSPDGRWIAAIDWRRRRAVLLDAHDYSRRRDLGSATALAWSPDSRYLLLWKYPLLRCGIGIDVEPGASFEIMEVASGKKKPVPSSRCQLTGGPLGWIASDIRAD